jgi:four helix bundle protein
LENIGVAGYRDLKVWQAGMLLANRVYRLTASFPSDERFGLTSQMRRSAISVPSNIAEGHARNTNAEMIRFCGIALGSVAEIETQLLLAADLDFAVAAEVDEILRLTDEIGRMLHGLIRSNREA